MWKSRIVSSLENLKGLATEDFILSANYECTGAEHWLLLKMSLLLLSVVISGSFLASGNIYFLCIRLWVWNSLRDSPVY